jgi:ABC-2 type transport system ATP-binding protein
MDTATAPQAMSSSQPVEPAASGSEYYIEVSDLVKVYGDVRAVDGINLRIHKGEVFAFLGPNGAGKTTTVEMIETIRTPTSGSIRLKGLDVCKRIDDVKKIIGVLPQEFSSFDNLRVRETLQFYSSLYGTHRSIDELMKLMDLGEHTRKLYKNLSGGLKQRVGIAVALVNDPEIVFLDEPTTGLDPAARREVWRVIAGLKLEGKTVFLTTHYMEEAEELADHVAIINHGKIIAEGSVEELIDKHGSGLTLIIHGPVGDLENFFKEHDLRPAECKDDLCLKIKDKDELLHVLQELKDHDIKFKEVNVRRSNLEEVFLKLTGEKLADGEKK